MTGGSRIIAIDGTSAESADAQDTDTAQAAIAADEAAPEAEWDEVEEPQPVRPRRWPAMAGLALVLCAVAGWSAVFVHVTGPQAMAQGTLAQWTAWIRDWSPPVLLIAVAWQLAMRNSRREALRYGETARLLSEEARRLETRLETVNRELSLAREFISAQSRDLEALGRIAADRISEHADRLAGLISDNGTRIDAIGSVSEAALDNMEKLRFQLPVIASSAKDVSNNIAAAGRTAQGQLEEMVQGFNRLNQFGQASERQVAALREQVDAALAEMGRQSEQIEALTQARFAALAERGESFRAELEAHEIEALAAVRTRAKALSDELDDVRGQLDGHEAESLTSLRARLTALRDESGAIARSVREGEGAALDAWRRAIAQLEQDLRDAVGKVGEIDQRAIESARERLAALTREAEDVDARMTARDQAFAEEIERRRAEFEARHAEFSQKLLGQAAALEGMIAERRAEQEAHGQKLAAHCDTMAAQLAAMSSRMAEIAAHGSGAEAAIAQSLDALAAKLAASREALAGTDTAIAALTDDSVRLLELIRAGVKHSEEDLPTAIGSSEARLIDLSGRIGALVEMVRTAQGHGDALAERVEASKAGLDHGIAQSVALESILGDKLAAITAIGQALEKLRADSAAAAQQARGELSASIAELDQSARAAVAGIEDMSAASLAALAGRIGEESAAAIDQALRAKASQIAGQLEQAAANAADVSREAAQQLRDQLAKVNDLAGNLERRVAHARERAQEQVDNDFARRVALITESLNSNAIDIARVMDAEVTDTAWAAYLKGDRGIFTRRAVRLLDASEAKEITQLFESDREFRDHVSRYIHDFEAMLRQLLSTRDGHALGVTLLSSDMGKLYVALAQAIERLRN